MTNIKMPMFIFMLLFIRLLSGGEKGSGFSSVLLVNVVGDDDAVGTESWNLLI